jgi:hypothetical protein
VDSADYNPYWLLYLGAIVLAGRYWKNAQDHGLETRRTTAWKRPTSLCFNNSRRTPPKPSSRKARKGSPD